MYIFLRVGEMLSSSVPGLQKGHLWSMRFGNYLVRNEQNLDCLDCIEDQNYPALWGE